MQLCKCRIVTQRALSTPLGPKGEWWRYIGASSMPSTPFPSRTAAPLRAFHPHAPQAAKKFSPAPKGDTSQQVESNEEKRKRALYEKLTSEEGRKGLQSDMSKNLGLTDEVRDEERVRMRSLLWPWLIIFSSTFVATGVIMSILQATYTEKGIDYFWSELMTDEQRFKLIEFLSFNCYNWSFLHRERVIETLLYTLEHGSDPEEWFYSIHALFSLIGAVRAEQRPLFVEQFTGSTNIYNLLLCMKDPLILKESNRFEGASSCLEELASIIYSVYIKLDNDVEITPELEALLIEYAEHGNPVHKRIASECFAKFAPRTTLIQEYVRRVNLHEMWGSSNRFGYDEAIVQNYIASKRSLYEVSDEEIPDHFISKTTKAIQLPINFLFSLGEMTRSNMFQSTLRAMLYTGIPMVVFWIHRFHRHFAFDFRKSTYLATRCLTRPLIFAFAINALRLGVQYGEEKILGLKERSKSTLVALAVLRYLLIYICALAMVWNTPEFSLVYPFIMYMIPWNATTARITGAGASAIPRKDYSYTDPMFFKGQRRVY